MIQFIKIIDYIIGENKQKKNYFEFQLVRILGKNREKYKEIQRNHKKKIIHEGKNLNEIRFIRNLLSKGKDTVEKEIKIVSNKRL